ncbi:hypothetical protein BU17DRAFT_95697 [Hysterangium stoloniferum]|nr:hypothetical protein BU17DRAFT_95697 [Hysterangium stoloniferum]
MHTVTQLLITEAYIFLWIDSEALIPAPTNSLPNSYQMDEITRTADVAALPPMVSPSAAITIADFRQSNDDIVRIMNSYNMLLEQWGCDEPGHDICLQGKNYVGHIQLSKEQISIWIGEICRGQATRRDPPKVFIVPDGSGSKWSPDFYWGASETNAETEDEIEPGYLCGLALERLGRTILYHSKVSLLFAKLLFYKQIVGGLYKRPSARMFGIILQETIDLIRPSYPNYIRDRASGIFSRVSFLPDERWGNDYIHIILECLGGSFRWFQSPEIMSALYRNLTGASLHIHYEEVLSTFVVIIARYLTSLRGLFHVCLHAFTFLAANLCHLRKLSFEELDAIHDYLETWLRKGFDSISSCRGGLYFANYQMKVSIPCSQQDARFHILSEALLDMALDTTIGTTLRDNDLKMFLQGGELAVYRFFADRALLIDDVKKISRIAPFIAFYLRHVVLALCQLISQLTFPF